MKWNTSFPSLCVSYDIKIYSSTPRLAGRDWNPFCSRAGALKKRETGWERVCNKPPEQQPVVHSDMGLSLRGLSLLCLFLSSFSASRITVGKYIFSIIFEHQKSIQSSGVFCQCCVVLGQRQIGFRNPPAQEPPEMGHRKQRTSGY